MTSHDNTLGMQSKAAYIKAMNAEGTMTAEELLRLQPPHKRTELVRGRLVVREPAGYEHGRIAAKEDWARKAARPGSRRRAPW